MKSRYSLVSLTAAALLVAASGCGERSVRDQTKATTDGTTGVLQKATDLAATGSAKAQELIDSAKQLVGEAKFQEALDKLKAIGAEKLSPTQQAVVNGLKAQIEKALAATSKAAADAGAAAAGALPKK